MKTLRFLAFTLSLVLISNVGFAREFTFKEAGFGTYIRGEFGLAGRGDASFADSGGSGISFDSSRTTNAGGEFGLMFSHERAVIRIATEVLLPKTLTGVNGTSAGTTEYTLDSKITAFLPQADVDFIIKKFTDSRILLTLGGGVAIVSTTNTYKMTAAGTTMFPGISDHTESGKGQSTFFQTSVGYEFMFADRATMVLDAGYRYCQVSTLTASDPVKTFTGNYAAGDTLKRNDGSARTLDLGGFYGGAGFRFYF